MLIMSDKISNRVGFIRRASILSLSILIQFDMVGAVQLLTRRIRFVDRFGNYRPRLSTILIPAAVMVCSPEPQISGFFSSISPILTLRSLIITKRLQLRIEIYLLLAGSGLRERR